MSYPRGLPKKYHRYWNKPWLRRASWSRGFRKWLDGHGYMTPHFTEAEAACKDGTPVPSSLKHGARGHAFRLERLRHRLGDKSVPLTSWYRTPSHNRAVGGASQSKHMQAYATDHPKSWVDAHGGQNRIKAVAISCGFKGIGVYPGGAMHFDSRPQTFVSWWTSW